MNVLNAHQHEIFRLKTFKLIRSNILSPVVDQNDQHDYEKYPKSNGKRGVCNFLWYVTPGWMLVHSTVTIRNAITRYTPYIGICLDIKYITEWGLEKNINNQDSEIKSSYIAFGDIYLFSLLEVDSSNLRLG